MYTLRGWTALLKDDEKVYWADRLPELVHAYNNSVHESTGLTPFFVEFGWHARLLVDLVTGAIPVRDPQTLRGWVQSHHKTLEWAYGTVRENAQRQHRRDEGRYNQWARGTPLLPGERVLLRSFRRRARGKLAPRWDPDPYVVVSSLGPGSPVYRVWPEHQEGPEKTIHRNNLRNYPWTVDPPGVPERSPAPPVKGRTPNRDEWYETFPDAYVAAC
ncbi:hypothetical protein EOD39_12604 [Acipenser ruthenus]|uniref:Uncharacterized protein n=1 Tax=Acipenser ruthenus TaxID=7906 RepID=A0A662YQM2_ACIRT|nr:hypothetical protein EOD39_12604 [Acipenser ruthenus]